MYVMQYKMSIVFYFFEKNSTLFTWMKKTLYMYCIIKHNDGNGLLFSSFSIHQTGRMIWFHKISYHQFITYSNILLCQSETRDGPTTNKGGQLTLLKFKKLIFKLHYVNRRSSDGYIIPCIPCLTLLHAPYYSFFV